MSTIDDGNILKTKCNICKTKIYVQRTQLSWIGLYGKEPWPRERKVWENKPYAS